MAKTEVIKPGDIIIIADIVPTRVWKVTGVFMGGVHQESVVSMVPLDYDSPSGKGDCSTIQVPLVMLEAAWEQYGMVYVYGQKGIS